MKRVTKRQSKFKIGLYIRVAAAEQAQTPDAIIIGQEQRLRQHVELSNIRDDFGEVAGMFIDRAKSGLDTNREQLQRLLAQVKRGKINFVLVTDPSRLSRSSRGLLEIKSLLKKHDCGLLCLSEQLYPIHIRLAKPWLFFLAPFPAKQKRCRK